MSRARRIGRQPAKRRPAARIVVATEGALTEPEYLKVFGRIYCDRSVRVVPIRVGGDPRTVVERAIEESKKSKSDGLATRDSAWAMFDRDIHDRFDEARALARGNGIRLAISNRV